LGAAATVLGAVGLVLMLQTVTLVRVLQLGDGLGALRARVAQLELRMRALHLRRRRPRNA
jgi:hypothetical protein